MFAIMETEGGLFINLGIRSAMKRSVRSLNWGGNIKSVKSPLGDMR